MSKANVVPLRKAVTGEKSMSMADQVKAKMSAAFNGIFRNAAETSPHSPGGKLPLYGAYGMQILYAEDGTPKHLVGVYIDKLRLSRPFTKNAIEVRCNALGLAIYVSGNPEVSADGKQVRTNVRIVVFLKDETRPSFQQTASSAEDLTGKLHSILVNTYNKQTHDYNLAGFPSSWLVLTCPSGSIPDIPLIMNSDA